MLLISIIAIAIVALALRGFLVMLLWNWLMPMLLSLPEVSFLEACGLFLLGSFLFGTFIDKNIVPAKKSTT